MNGMNGGDQGLLPFDDGSMGRLIRRVWHEGRWYFSVNDVVAVLTDSQNPGNYWAVLKRRLVTEGASEVVTNCHRLKMRSLDGKMHPTDAADTETMLRIVQSVPSPKAEPIKQWLAHEGARRLDEVAAQLPEGQQRLLLRGEMADRNRALADAAAGAGVITSRDFAVFQDFGYMGLYGGEKARDIAARKGLAKGEKVLDWMNPEELASNIFRAAQTTAKLTREGTDNKADANQTHFTVGREVRETIARLGGTMPEDLPTPEQSIQQLERAEQQRIVAEQQPQLFADDRVDK
jgi:DNA-damage-inducible protein D